MKRQVTNDAARRLYAKSVLVSKGRPIHPSHLVLHTQPRAEGRDMRGVSAGVGAEAMIDVDCDRSLGSVQRDEHVEEADRVGAA